MGAILLYDRRDKSITSDGKNLGKVMAWDYPTALSIHKDKEGNYTANCGVLSETGACLDWWDISEFKSIDLEGTERSMFVKGVGFTDEWKAYSKKVAGK